MIKNVGILGAGSMGSGIAQVAATAGHKVNIFDTNKSALDLSKSKLKKIMIRLIEKGRLTVEQSLDIQNNISYCIKLEELKDSNIIIEAIIENLDIKKSVFKSLESIVAKDTILATNTSSLSVTAIAAACERADQVIGIHFFNPAPLMKLVEIVPALQTSEQTTTSALKLIQNWGKLTVLAKDTPGFIVNRVARPFYGEALRILEEGHADVPTIDWAMTSIAGFRMGPFTLMDYIGNDVNYVVTKTVFEAFYFDPRYKPSFTQKQLSDAGYYGRKSGKGYYDYNDITQNPKPSEDQAIGKIIADRIVIMLINEAADALFFNIATREDIDTAMTKGVNYPKGLLKWADEIGIQNCVDKLDELYDIYHEDRYRCSPLLRKMTNEGVSFY